MRGITELGVFAIFLIAAVLMLGTFTMETGASPPQSSSSGNHTNMSISSSPTNSSNNSNALGWVDFNWTFNGSINSCIVEIGNQTGYQNLTGSVSPTGSTTDACYVNATYNKDTTVGLWYNITVYALNDTISGVLTSRTTRFRVDTATPVVTVVGVANHNDTYNIAQKNGVNPLQNYLNVSWNVADNTTVSCKVEVLWESITSKSATLGATVSTKVSYANFSANVTSKTSATTATRRFEAMVPAKSITNDIYQGRIWVKPWCTDAVGKEGGTVISDYQGVIAVNPLLANTWTPLGIMQSTTNLATVINYTLAYGGNISYIAAYEFNNASFRTHQWHQYTYGTEVVDVANSSAVYVYPSTSWTLLRINTTTMNYLKSSATGNITVYYNDTSGKARGNWRAFSNIRANTTKYILNNTGSCGIRLDYLAWFNSTDGRCLGGCWETYRNNFGVNNETMIPFGTAFWLITNGSNMTMTAPNLLTTGDCADSTLG